MSRGGSQDPFYRRLDEKEAQQRTERIFADRPDDLHDYQGCANDPKMVASPAQISDEPKNNIDLCDCGHRREKHHHSLGLCEATAVNGHICVCSRFKYPKFDIKVEDAKLVVAARSRLEPVEAPHCECSQTKSEHRARENGACALFQPMTLKQEVEKLRAIDADWKKSEDPLQDLREIRYGPKVSTPLPQQEEPATRKMILWEASGIAENLWREDDNRWNRAIRAYRDEIQKLISAPIAPLLGQDEPKFDWKRMEEVAADELCNADEHGDHEICVACMAIRGTRWALQMRSSLTQALTSLASAQKDKDDARAYAVVEANSRNYWSERAGLAESKLAAAQKEIERYVGYNEELLAERLRNHDELGKAGKYVMEHISRAELAEASLAEAQTRISELEKEK